MLLLEAACGEVFQKLKGKGKKKKKRKENEVASSGLNKFTVYYSRLKDSLLL